MTALFEHVGDKYVRQVEKESVQLNEEAIGGLLGFAGNHGGKALTLLLMDRYPNSENSDLFHELHLLEKKADADTWPKQLNVINSWLVRSIDPTGIIMTNTIGYRLNALGEEVAIPLLGHALELTLEYGFSLQDVFGTTHAKSKGQEKFIFQGEEYPLIDSSAVSRLKILRAILDSEESLSITKIEKLTGESMHNVRNHLKSLSESGIINYTDAPFYLPRESWQKFRVNLTYKIHEEGIQFDSQKYVVSQKVWQFLVDNIDKEFSVDEIRQYLGYKSDDLIKDCLQDFARQGFLSKHNPQEASHYTTTNLSNTQREFLSRLFRFIDGIKNHDTLIISEGKLLARFLLNSPEKIKKIIESTLASTINNSDKLPLSKRIFDFLSTTPITVSELARRLECDPSSLRQMLKKLENKGMVQSVETKSIAKPNKAGPIGYQLVNAEH